MNSTVKIVGLFAFIIILIALSLLSIFKDFGASSGSTQHSHDLGREQVEQIISEYLDKNPEKIANALIAYQQKAEENRAKDAQKYIIEKKAEIEENPNDPIAGNANGDVTVVEFFDYSCGYCKRVFPLIEKLLNEDKNVKIVFKELPILGPNSVMTSKAALALHQIAPDKYFAFHKQAINSRISGADSLMKIVSDLGVDSAKVKELMDKPEINEKLSDIHELASSLGIRGTPAFIIGNTLVPGAVSYEDMVQLIEEARKGN